MLRITSIIGVIITALSIIFATSAAPAYAAGISVDPSSGNKDTTYTVQADGFNPNERVSTWVQTPNGTTIGLDELKADSTGSVEFSVTPDSAWKNGEAIVVAHGLSSKREYSAKFNIVASGGDDSSDTPTSTTSGSYIANDPSSLTITYYGSGYAAGERVATWFQYPTELATSAAHMLPDVTADASGNVSFDFTVGSDWPYGGYNVAAQGAQSKHTTNNTFSFFGTISDQHTYWATSGTSGTVTANAWQGQYWDNMYFSGDPVLVRQEAEINFNWGGGSPGTNVPADHFSARWDTLLNVSDASNYLVTATADDGIRVWIDGNLVIDQWGEHSATTYTTTVYPGTGQHTAHVEYFENYGDAVAFISIDQQ